MLAFRPTLAKPPASIAATAPQTHPWPAVPRFPSLPSAARTSSPNGTLVRAAFWSRTRSWRRWSNRSNGPSPPPLQGVDHQYLDPSPRRVFWCPDFRRDQAQNISLCIVGRTVSVFRFFLGFAQVSEFRAQVREVTHLGSTNFFQCIAVGWHGSSTDEDHDFWLEVLTQESQFRLQP